MIEVELAGPDSDSLDNLSNPFRVQVDVRFTDVDGGTMVVPAFYDGDGTGGPDGNVWKVRFRPNKPGEWQFASTSAEASLNGYQGSFTVLEGTDCPAYSPGGLPDFECTGFLRYAGGHYLRFDSGEYWIKGGVDDPENFLGEAFGDWAGKRAAVDYLASKSVNSIYVITNNIDGDDNDTWPWAGEAQREARQNSDRFNVPKLKAWEDFFSYVQSKGIVLHLVLNDDSAWNGYDPELYFREMVARFGHHAGIIWNIGEEANEIYSDQEQSLLAATLRQLDPYEHPITTHRKPLWPFLGDANFDLTSLQPGNGASDFSRVRLAPYNRIVANHREQSQLAGRPIPVMVDETPRITKVTEEIRLKMRAEVLYPIYFAGGNYELHFNDSYSQGGAVTVEDLEPMLEDMQRLRQFLERSPFEEMEPCNELLSEQEGYCFGKQGESYVIYLPSGGDFNIDLTAIPANLEGKWISPRDSTEIEIDMVFGSQLHNLTAPTNEDWILHLQ